MKNYEKLFSLMENKLRLKVLIELKFIISAMEIAEITRLSINKYELTIQDFLKKSIQLINKDTERIFISVDIEDNSVEFSPFTQTGKRELVLFFKVLPFFKKELKKKQKELIDQMSSLL